MDANHVGLKSKKDAAQVDLNRLSDAQLLGLTGAGEARSVLVPHVGWRPAPLADMVAVMWTPVHRLATGEHARFGGTIAEVCLRPSQYSCWNAGVANRLWLLDQADRMLNGGTVDFVVQSCIAQALQMAAGVIEDSVNGATHYYAKLSMVPPGRVPTWAVGQTPCAVVGQHLFFKGV